MSISCAKRWKSVTNLSSLPIALSCHVSRWTGSAGQEVYPMLHISGKGDVRAHSGRATAVLFTLDQIRSGVGPMGCQLQQRHSDSHGAK